jgi:valyl-tRNA synthetase
MLDKTYSPADIEQRIYELWEASGAFRAGQRPAARPFTIVIPPPNVTGSLHMGHALNNTIQDILARFERMRGRDVLWQPGMDHAGIATQMVVERQLEDSGLSRRAMSREEFISRVWSWKAESGGMILNQLKRLGASCDWSRERFTMDEGLSRAVLQGVRQLYKEGLIYKDKRLVNWDPKLLTAISDLEVQPVEVKGHLWHIRYPIEGEPGRHIVVATTRPETMLGDSGVAVHPDDERYKSLSAATSSCRWSADASPSSPTTTPTRDRIGCRQDDAGARLQRLRGRPPPRSGDDQRARCPCQADARRQPRVPRWRRLSPNCDRRLKLHEVDRFEARRQIVERLEAADLIERIEPHTHTVPHGDRGGVPIEPWLTEQWYVDAATLAKPAIESVEQGRTVFVPKAVGKDLFRVDAQHPAVVHLAPVVVGPPDPRLVRAGRRDLRRGDRESGARRRRAPLRLAHHADPRRGRARHLVFLRLVAVLHPGLARRDAGTEALLSHRRPGDRLRHHLLLGGADDDGGPALHGKGAVPHRLHPCPGARCPRPEDVEVQGQRHRPLDLIKDYGADALRFTLAAMAAQGRDIKLAPGRVEGYRNFGTKLWNAARFCEMSGVVRDPDFDPVAARLTLNRWIAGELVRTRDAVTAGIEEHRYNEAAAALYSFAWHVFCDWYLELIKPILTGDDEAARPRRAMWRPGSSTRSCCCSTPSCRSSPRSCGSARPKPGRPARRR